MRAALLAAALAPGASLPAEPGLAVSQPYRLSPHVAPGETYGAIRLLGTVVLDAARIDGLVLGGLSGLAWDEDDARLYALSDVGTLFELRPRFEDGRLAGVEALAAHRLLDGQGRPLERPRNDAEGLVVQNADNGRPGDSVLVVSFERYPRIRRFRPDGHAVDDVPLPEPLRHTERYESPNKALESLAWMPGRGFLTAPERPMAGDEEGMVRLFSVSSGASWGYPLASTPNASLVDLEALPDGTLLCLERGHGLLFLPMITTLRRARIDWSTPGSMAEVATLATLDTSEGFSVDNFEGLTRYHGLEFFMVSDDNFNDLQKTLLVHFALAALADTPAGGNAREYEPGHKTTR